MRKPTPKDEALSWWRKALKQLRGDGRTTMEAHINEPHVGFFKRRLVRMGPFVPARIWIEASVNDDGELVGDEVMRCEVDGHERDPEDEWIYLCQYPISEKDFEFLRDSSNWAKFRDHREPLARPREPVNWFAVPPPVVPKKKGKSSGKRSNRSANKADGQNRRR